MFYSHEILTSRKHGVATVWLVATLGSKSNLKKVNKKEILDVKIPRACQTILDPEAPLALRLQGNLLFGVSRVYEQKCNYLLTDAESARQIVRTLMGAMRTTQEKNLSPSHKARKEQITLADDPSFAFDIMLLHPKLGMAMDIDSVIGSTMNSQISMSVGSHGDEDDAASAHNLFPAQSGSSVTGLQEGLELPGSNAPSDRARSTELGIYDIGDPGLLPLEDPGFAFDTEGNLIEGNPSERGLPTQYPSRAGSAAARGDEAEARNAYALAMTAQDDNDILPGHDDLDQIYQDAEAFSPRTRPQAQESELSEEAEVLSSSSSVVAPVRRARRPKPLPLDQRMELKNRDITAWQTNYIQNMDAAKRAKATSKSVGLAKANAAFLILKNGVGGLGRVIGTERVPDQFQIFFGSQLLAALTGRPAEASGEKRARDESPAEANDERRVRPRTDDGEVGRGIADDDLDLQMDDTAMSIDDTAEIGRRAETPLAERMSSTMPWNVSASIRGSSARPRSTSIQHQAQVSTGIAARISSAARRQGVSSSAAPSPLLGYGLGMPPEDAGMEAFQLDNPDFTNVYDPGATDEGGNTRAHIRQSLDPEANNFLLFLQDAINERVANADQEAGSDLQDRFMGFEELLPPTENTKAVAAQGFLHVLTLVTKNLMSAEQADDEDGSFPDIGLSILGSDVVEA